MKLIKLKGTVIETFIINMEKYIKYKITFWEKLFGRHMTLSYIIMTLE